MRTRSGRRARAPIAVVAALLGCGDPKEGGLPGGGTAGGGEGGGEETGEEAGCAEPPRHEGTAENGLVDDLEILVEDPTDARCLREALIARIWGEAGYPEDLRPDAVEEDVTAPIPSEAARVDRLTVTLDGGFTSLVYVFYPAEPDGGLAIVHQGHSPTLDVGGIDTAIGWFLARGDVVLAHSMPLYGEFTGPVESHDELFYALTDPDDLSPFAVFLDPVAASLGWALEELDVDEVAMTGVSGGGWTTTLVAALDERVRISLPVAGSLPLALRDATDIGDTEQNYEHLYALAGYPDLYLLGTTGAGREQIQVLNRYDGCCFAGLRYQAYAEEVGAAAAALDGEGWRFFLDESHTGHEISAHALAAAFGPALDGEGVRVLDDLSPAWGDYAAEGDWTAWTDQGFGSTLQSAPAGDGESLARWTFSVEPGRYAVHTTWTAHENRASDAPYTLSGDEELGVRLDQRAAPADLEAEGVDWALLGEVETTSGLLTVTLTNDADGYVIADAVRLEPAP